MTEQPDALLTEGAVEIWLKQLRNNARMVNDGEGEPLALKCEEALARLAAQDEQLAELGVKLLAESRNVDAWHKLNAETEARLAQITEERDNFKAAWEAIGQELFNTTTALVQRAEQAEADLARVTQERDDADPLLLVCGGVCRGGGAGGRGGEVEEE